MRSILLVEDDVPLRQFFRTALGHAGFKVREVSDGLSALQALDDDRPDVVVLDLELPVVSGHVVSQEIAAQAQTRDIPVVVVVTGTQGDLQQLKLDVDCILTKPVTADRLVETVQGCLASKQAKRSPPTANA